MLVSVLNLASFGLWCCNNTTYSVIDKTAFLNILFGVCGKIQILGEIAYLGFKSRAEGAALAEGGMDFVIFVPLSNFRKVD